MQRVCPAAAGSMNKSKMHLPTGGVIMRKAWVGTLCFLLLHFYSASANAQATSRVAGTVQDKTGAVVVGANVTLTNEATNISVSTVTTSAGTYVFDGIAP